MTAPALFHWSPRERRPQIERYGLRPGMRPTISCGGAEYDDGFRPNYVCLAEDPQWAWCLSGAHHPEIRVWDLWQVWLADGHHFRRLRADRASSPERRWHEWRVYDRIYKRGVWWVAERVLA